MCSEKKSDMGTHSYVLPDILGFLDKILYHLKIGFLLRFSIISDFDLVLIRISKAHLFLLKYLIEIIFLFKVVFKPVFRILD